MIKCYHCSGKHTSVAEVKACSKVTSAFAAKVEIGKVVETVIPDTVKVETFVPAHRKTSVAKLHAAAVAAANDIAQASVAMVKIPGLDVSIPVTGLFPVNEQPASAALPAIKKGQDLDLGMYQVKEADGTVTVYKVTTGKYSSHKQAQKLWITQKDFFNQETKEWDVKPVGKFHFASGMMAKLTSENKMSEADAKAFHDATKKKYGQDYGFCCVCGKLLTVKKSIEDGIGPVCKGKI